MTAVLLLAVALGALFIGVISAAAHQSLRDLPRGRLEEIIKANGIGVRKSMIRAILDADREHAAAVALPRVVANLVVLISTVGWIAELRGHAAPDMVDISAGTAIAAVIIWSAGVVFPIALAEHAGERVILSLCRYIRLMHGLTLPLRACTNWLDVFVARLSGSSTRTASEELEAELRSVVEEGKRGGGIDEEERDMIEAVVKFRSTSVERIMTPRTEVNAMPYTDNIVEVLESVLNTGHSRIPVFEENLDHVSGVLYAKDLLGWLARATDKQRDQFRLSPLLRDAHFVPETKMVRDLLSELLEKNVHLAMVADEYGGTSGLVTLEDIIEEVFGDIRDEYEIREQDVEPSCEIDPETRSAAVDARMRIDDLNDELEDLGVELPDAPEYDTLGGFVVTSLGRIPQAGEVLEIEQARIEVLEADAARVVRLRVDSLVEPETEDDENQREQASPAGAESE